MAINLSEKQFFCLLRDNQSADPSPTLEKTRLLVNDLFSKYAGVAANVPVTECFIKARDKKDIRVRIFNPNVQGPTLFFLPGNAFLFNLFESNAIAASRIAYYGKFRVIIVDYRLMPENPWPTTINDVDDVMVTMCKQQNPYGIAMDSIYLSGICSGAQAAAIVAIQNNHKLPIKKLILLNGLYDQSLSQDQYAALEKEDEMVVRSSFAWWFEHYKISPEEAKISDRSPLYAKGFSALPEVLLIVAEHDGFRSDSEAFYLKLQKNQAKVSKIVIEGQTHNTMLLRSVMRGGDDPAEIIAKAILSS